MSKRRDDTARGLTLNFAETTSMHGVSRIVGKPGVFRRCFWILAVLGGAGVAGYNIWIVAVAYSRWDVSTTVSLEYNSMLNFPSVTICNLNPVKIVEFNSNPKLRSLRTKLSANSKNPSQDEDYYYTDWENSNTSTLSYNTYDERHQTLQDIHQAITLLNRLQKLQVGHSKDDILLECTFQGRPCAPRNFTAFYNYMYGNCFVFNVEGTKAVSKTGPLHGLSLTLYVEEFEYISALTDGVGFKVVVHSSDIMPFPEDEGFNVSPGYVNSVGVTKVEVNRAAAPYGDCMTYRGSTSPPNIFTTELDNIDYSEKACLRSCLQQHLLRTCGCCDNRYPCTERARNIIVDNSTYFTGFCNILDLTSPTRLCAETIKEQFEMGNLTCGSICVQNCHDESYQLEISSALWPPSAKVRQLAKNILRKARKNRVTLQINENSTIDEMDLFVRRNTLRVDVFYKQLNYEKIETRPAYDWSRLLSDVGGQAGLWLGFSLLTLGEVLELLLDITISFFGRCCKSETKQIKPVR